jgi:hypothetical protein
VSGSTAYPADQNYGTMQSRIADEVLGATAVTTSHITNAIQDAIREYERSRFWFNEMRWDEQPVLDSSGRITTDSSGAPILSSPLFNTAVGQEWYGPGTDTLIGSVVHLDMLRVIQGTSNRWRLTPRTPGWMDDRSVITTALGLPTDWCFNGGQIRLYPIPTQVYPIIGAGTLRWQLLVNATDINPWMTWGERLIRQAAKAIIYRDILEDDAAAARCEQDAARAKQGLDSETTRRLGPLRIRAHGP